MICWPHPAQRRRSHDRPRYIGRLFRPEYFIEALDTDISVFEEVRAKLPQANDGAIRNLLERFYSGRGRSKKTKHLSGGEKTRVVLSYLLSIPFNCLVLDEPTNHLDIRSREVLLDVLKRYGGTVLPVSHYRYFLREIVNRVFEIDRGKITVYEGDYRYYLQEKEGKGIF